MHRLMLLSKSATPVSTGTPFRPTYVSLIDIPYTSQLTSQMKKAENFQAPSASQAAAGVTYNPSCHAANGPIGIQYDPNS